MSDYFCFEKQGLHTVKWISEIPFYVLIRFSLNSYCLYGSSHNLFLPFAKVNLICLLVGSILCLAICRQTYILIWICVQMYFQNQTRSQKQHVFWLIWMNVIYIEIFRPGRKRICVEYSILKTHLILQRSPLSKAFIQPQMFWYF